MSALRRQIFFALQRAIGSRAGAAYRQMLEMERWSADRLRAWRNAQIRSLLDSSARGIPFYRERFSRAPERLDELPIIRKAELSAHFLALMRDDLRAEYEGCRPRKRYGWLAVTSGGTTGLPTTVIHDADFRDLDRAARAYAQDLCGFPIGTPHFRLWGSMEDLRRSRRSLQQRAMAALNRETLLNAFRMEDDRIRAYLDMINRSRIRHMIAYVDGADQLARFAEREGIAMRPLVSIMATGGTLTDDTRERLRRVFGARVHNKYGSRDAGELACECEAGGLHVLSANAHIEILDEKGAPCPPGVVGRVIVTCLSNAAFPILRFDIEDRAAWVDRPCSCGRPFPLLERLEGRATDFLPSATGGFVSPVFIRHVVGVVHGKQSLRRFQLECLGNAKYVLRLQPESGIPRNAIEAFREPLLRDLRAVLGEAARIEWRIVDDIPESASGKFRYILNRAPRA